MKKYVEISTFILEKLSKIRYHFQIQNSFIVQVPIGLLSCLVLFYYCCNFCKEIET